MSVVKTLQWFGLSLNFSMIYLIFINVYDILYKCQQ